MSRIGRSARTRDARLARRRADITGFDRGGGRRSIFKSRYAKIFYVVGLVGLIGSLIPLLLIGGNNNSTTDSAQSQPAIRRLVDPADAEIGAVDKPTYDAPPAFPLDPALDYYVVLELESGEVRIQLFDDVTPVHAANFAGLVEDGFYDDLTFHRVVEGDLAQSGDPTATNDEDAGYRLGDDVLTSLPEPLTLADTGLVAMARIGGEVSGSQFFITLSPQPQLDTLGFVPFGRVVEGLDLVQALTPRNPLAVPVEPAGDRILGAHVESVAAGSETVTLPYASTAQPAGESVADTPPTPDGEDVDIGAVAGKPQWAEPPAFALDPGLDYSAVLELETGTVTIDLFEDVAPIHANNFVFLANEGFYDGLTFHRVIEGFVAQGGDPTALGTGGSGYQLPDEEVGDNADRLTIGRTGVIAMARSGLGASGSQFFITYEPQGFLDVQGFTAFGEVVDGMEAVQALPPRDPGTVPTPAAGGRILSVTIETVPKAG